MADTSADGWFSVRKRGPVIAVGTALWMTMVVGVTAAAAAPTSVHLAPSSVPVPHIEGPVTGPGTPSIISTSFNLASVGYEQSEYFISGTATRYAGKGTAPADGRWSVRPAGRAGYKTRLLVYRPKNARAFDGTVVVEWLNESAGADTAPDWIGDHTQLISQGTVWVGVSAQALGVQGGTSVLQDAGTGLRGANPARYGTLHHPGDAYSYDIFSQAAQAIWHPGKVSVLGGLRPKALIADGESQSAFFLTTYIDAIAPGAHVFDGYMVHSRWGGGTTLAGTLDLTTRQLLRTDLGVPVLAFETETDITEGYALDRQPDSRWFRDWEVAGTSHADDYTTSVGMTDTGNPDVNVAAAVVADDTPLGFLGCTGAPNSGPQHWVLDSAIAALTRWVTTGVAPPHAPRLETTSGPHPTIERNALGIALGGIRTPDVDVPISVESGIAAPGQSVTCSLFGSTTPFTTATLLSLYPNHADYVADVEKAAHAAVVAGFLPRLGDAEIVAAAQASDIE